jgi:hypothetical protein
MVDIINNTSQAGQDLFAYCISQNATFPKTYIELGAQEPIYLNNTYFLEQQGWTGGSIEIDSHWIQQFSSIRRNPIIHADATTIHWEEYFTVLESLYPNKNTIGYLSFDVDDATYHAFNHFPFDKIKCGVITIEHDVYRVGPELRNYLRDKLIQFGYVLICADVFLQGFGEFEDWWVHPELVNMEHAKQFMFQNTDSVTIIEKMKSCIS